MSSCINGKTTAGKDGGIRSKPMLQRGINPSHDLLIIVIILRLRLLIAAILLFRSLRPLPLLASQASGSLSDSSTGAKSKSTNLSINSSLAAHTANATVRAFQTL